MEKFGASCWKKYPKGGSLDLPGIDGVALSTRTILEAVSKEGVMRLKLSDGLRLKGLLHSSLKNGEARRIVA